jgi:hypothetical protein
MTALDCACADNRLPLPAHQQFAQPIPADGSLDTSRRLSGIKIRAAVCFIAVLTKK